MPLTRMTAERPSALSLNGPANFTTVTPILAYSSSTYYGLAASNGTIYLEHRGVGRRVVDDDNVACPKDLSIVSRSIIHGLSSRRVRGS